MPPRCPHAAACLLPLQSGLNAEPGQQLAVPAGGAAGRYVVVYTGMEAEGQMSLSDVEVYAYGEQQQGPALWCAAGLLLPPLRQMLAALQGLLQRRHLAAAGRPSRASKAPCSPAETNAAANKPVGASALSTIDRGGAGVVLQSAADSNASTCVPLQPDIASGDASSGAAVLQTGRGGVCSQPPVGAGSRCMHGGLCLPSAAACNLTLCSCHRPQPGCSLGVCGPGLCRASERCCSSFRQPHRAGHARNHLCF